MRAGTASPLGCGGLQELGARIVQKALRAWRRALNMSRLAPRPGEQCSPLRGYANPPELRLAPSAPFAALISLGMTDQDTAQSGPQVHVGAGTASPLGC